MYVWTSDESGSVSGFGEMGFKASCQSFPLNPSEVWTNIIIALDISSKNCQTNLTVSNETEENLMPYVACIQIPWNCYDARFITRRKTS